MFFQVLNEVLHCVALGCGATVEVATNYRREKAFAFILKVTCFKKLNELFNLNYAPIP
jgi:hypothetical protein